MAHESAFRIRFFIPATCLAGLLSALPVFAAGNTLIPSDSNTGLNIENAVVNGDTTTVLFSTYPNLGDPGAGRDCPLNFYTVSLTPGLPEAEAKMVAKNVCGSSMSRARLLGRNDVLVLAGGRMEHWLDGTQRESKSFSDFPATGKPGIDFGSGGLWHSMTITGDVVLALPVQGGNGGEAGLQVVSLDANAGLHWQLLIAEPGQNLMVENLWATAGGGAVVRAGLVSSDYSSLSTRNRLYYIDAGGALKEPVELTVEDQQPDLETLAAMDPAEVQKEMQRMADSRPENIRKLDVDAGADGGFDVLLQRQGGLAGREGYFLMRFGADGKLQDEVDVTGPVDTYGLGDWVDFHIDGRKLVLLSRVLASQPSVQSRRAVYSQNVVASIDLDDKTLESRLLPLDLRYLQAVMDAGDEELQYIDNWPGGEPVLLTSLGGLPLVVSRGHLSGRSALRLNEATADLPAYTETYDKARSDVARQAAEAQRKANRDANKAQLNADLAAAVGMTPEQFAALSNQERKQAMLDSGNYDALATAGLKQAPSTSKSAAALDTQDVSAQIATAMAEAQENLPPEMAEQVAAALAQVQQQMDASGMGVPSGASSAQTAGADETTVTQTDADAFAMTVMDAFTISGRGVVITGRIDAGTVRVGDTVCLLGATAGKKVLKIKGIEKFQRTMDMASAGDTPGILVEGIEVGDITRNDKLNSSCDGGL